MAQLRTFIASAFLPSVALFSTVALAETPDVEPPAQPGSAPSSAITPDPAKQTESPPPAPASAQTEEEGIPLRQPPAPQENNTRTVTETKAQKPGTGRQEKPVAKKSERASSDDSDAQKADDEESAQFGYLALGPAMLSITGYEEFGFALAGGGRFPVHDRIAVNAGVSWALTSFDRTGEWWEEARKIGSWTTRAYGNVTEWAGEGEDDDAFRYVAAFYAYIGLLFPYAVSGMMYILGPFAATSSLDFHMEATFHLLETRKGPYVGAGLGTAAIIFPIEREMKGAFGPSLNLGFDFGWFGVEARGFYSPPHLHGEPTVYRTDIFTGQFLFRFQGK